MKKQSSPVALFLLLMLSLQISAMSVCAQEVELSMEEISYTTADQITLFGSWIIPYTSKQAKTRRRPVVILLHDYGVNRRDWGIFIPELVQQGYHVLAMDLRGHGQSQGRDQYSHASLVQTGYLDVQAALEWIKQQKDSDSKNVSLIGVGVGADIAYVCSGKFTKQLNRTVVISPSYSSITDSDFIDIKPRAILFCASVGGKQGTSMLAAESLSNFTQEPKKIVIYKSSAHGLAIFYKHPEIKQEIFNWLQN